MRRIIILLALAMVAAACAKPASPDPNQVSQLVQKAVEATLAAQPTQVAAPTATVLPPTVAPTATREQPAPVTTVPTAVPTNTSTPAPTATPALTDTPTVVPSVTPTMAPSVIADKAVNLRAGPGTNYPVVGAAKVGDRYDITARNQDGSWLQVCCVNGKSAWVSASVVTVGGGVDSVAVAQNVPPPPTPRPAPPPAPVAVRQSGQNGRWWPIPPPISLAALTTTTGTTFGPKAATTFSGRTCNDPTRPAATVTAAATTWKSVSTRSRPIPAAMWVVQWKASRGGTYRFEWDSPWLKFYKHADFISTQGKGSELPFSAIIKDAIEWEMFFWVAGDSTPYHVRVYRLDETSGPSQSASQPAPAPASGGYQRTRSAQTVGWGRLDRAQHAEDVSDHQVLGCGPR